MPSIDALHVSAVLAVMLHVQDRLKMRNTGGRPDVTVGREFLSKPLGGIPAF